MWLFIIVLVYLVIIWGLMPAKMNDWYDITVYWLLCLFLPLLGWAIWIHFVYSPDKYR